MEKPIKVKRTIGNVLNKKILGSAITFLLIGVLLGSFISYSTTPSSTLYLTGGIHSGAPTYTVWTDGTYIYSKDANGFIVCTDADPTIVLNFMISNMTSGGILFVKAGTYTFSNYISIYRKNNIQIKGEGSGCNFRSEISGDFAMATLFIPASDTFSQLIYIEQSYNIKISSIAFEGNSWISSAINCYDVHMLDLTDNYFRGFVNNAVTLYAVSASKYNAQNWIMKNTFSLETVGCVGIALQGNTPYLKATEDTLIFGNFFFSEWTDRGFGVWFAEPSGGGGSGLGNIDSITVSHNGFYFLEKAIVINADDGSVVENNNFEGNTEDIVLAGAYYIRTHFINNKNTDFITPLVVTNTATDFTGLFVENTGFLIEHHTADDTLTILESGTVHTNLGAGAAVALTLPQNAFKGTFYEFTVMTAQAFRIDPGAAGAIYINGAKGTDNKYYWADDEGESLKLMADGYGDWVAISAVGTWTSE
jgi:hypothetical protein